MNVELYSVKEVAKILKVNGSAVYKLIAAEKLPVLRLNGYKIISSDLEAFILDTRDSGEVIKTDELEAVDGKEKNL